MLRRVTISTTTNIARSRGVTSSFSAAALCNNALRFGGGGGAAHHGEDDHHGAPVTEVHINPAATQAGHKRSKFEYVGSTKGEEVGARNEAAFIQYIPSTPSLASNPAAVFGMPHLVNLLTIAPLTVAMLVVAAATWGIVMWRFYASQNFRSIVIERPAVTAA
jgi:hypothetical protein